MRNGEHRDAERVASVSQNVEERAASGEDVDLFRQLCRWLCIRVLFHFVNQIEGFRRHKTFRSVLFQYDRAVFFDGLAEFKVTDLHSVAIKQFHAGGC